MLNGMSEQEFYDMYPTQEDWENAQQMKLGGLSGAPHNGQPTADQFFSYGSHYNDSINVPMGNPYYAAEGGTPYYGGPIRPYAPGGVTPAGTMAVNNSMSVNKKMSPEEWTKYNTDLGYEVAKNYNSPNVKYPAYVNSKEYAYDDSGFGGYKKIGDVGKTTDYTKDPTYKPYNEYNYKAPVAKQVITPKKAIPERDPNRPTWNFNSGANPSFGGTDYTNATGTGTVIPPIVTNNSPAIQQTGTTPVAAVPPMSTPKGEYGGYMAYGGGLPGGANEYNMPCMNCGGYMEQGGDYNSPTNYGSFPAIQAGGVLNADNNMSYPMLEDGGRYNLLNLIKAASKKMKKAYGGDTVTQGGNSDNYNEGITKDFLKGIQNNTMSALMNEEEEGASYAVKQMGGPQLNPQNAAMQNMYQQRVDNLQNNVDQSGQDFMNAGKAFAQTYNPYTKTSVKAADGIQVLLNKQTGKPFTAEEYAEYQKYFGKDGSKEASTTSGNTKGNIYNYGPAQGTNYFPMNYRNVNKISKADDAMLRQLAANPTTNLKEYKNFNFGPFGRTKMKFGYKDIDPEFKPTGNKEYTPNTTTENKTNTITNTNTETNSNKTESPNSRMTVEDMNKRGVYAPGMTVDDQLVSNLYRKQSEPKQGPIYQEKLTDDWNRDINNKQVPLPSVNNKAYGGGLYEYQMAGEAPMSFPSWGSPIGGPAAPTPTPQSAGFGQNNIMMNGATDKPAPFTSGKTSGFEGANGPEKEATITQKRKTGLNREAAVNWGLAGINKFSSILEQNQDRSSEQLADSQIAGNAFLAKPANAASYGDYNINSGDFRENQKVPVQFPGNTAATNNTGFAAYGGYMEEGGESDEEIYEDDLTDEEIAELRAQGYDVEYI